MPRLRKRVVALTVQAQTLMQHADSTLTVADQTLLQLLKVALELAASACDPLDELKDGVHATIDIMGKRIPVVINVNLLEEKEGPG